MAAAVAFRARVAEILPGWASAPWDGDGRMFPQPGTPTPSARKGCPVRARRRRHRATARPAVLLPARDDGAPAGQHAAGDERS